MSARARAEEFAKLAAPGRCGFCARRGGVVACLRCVGPCWIALGQAGTAGRTDRPAGTKRPGPGEQCGRPARTTWPGRSQWRARGRKWQGGCVGRWRTMQAEHRAETGVTFVLTCAPAAIDCNSCVVSCARARYLMPRSQR